MSSVGATNLERTDASEWTGGRSPFGVGNVKFAMWLFLLADALNFGGLLFGYGMARLASTNWPKVTEIFRLELVGVMTFVLICSSAVMALAVDAARRGDRAGVLRFLGLTILGGAVFLGLQVYEWSHFIHEGARLASNPWGVPLFSGSFFVITGFHGLHVLSGVIYLAVVALRAARGHFSAEGTEVVGLYWHFVDLVWVAIFTLFYLI